MKLRPRWLIAAAVLVVVVIGLKVTLFRPQPVEVEVAEVSVGPVEDAVTNSQAGTVKARLRARLGVERAGRVAQIPHREGSRVKQGEVLLELDASSARVGLDMARRERDALKAALQSARASATLARQDYARVERLRAQGLVSEGEMDQARSRRDGAEAELEAAQARLARAETAVRLAQNELTHLRVVAPFSGVVTARLVELGESVVPGQPVLELTSLERLYVSAPIDEIDIGRLATGLPARVTLDPHPGLVWSGTVTRVSAVVDELKEQNRTLEVEVELTPDPKLPQPRPGSSADVQIILARSDGVVRVPTFAVAEGKRVLVAENGKARQRDVEAGLKNWEWTEIRSGLKPGERVITNLDKQGLKAGVPVKVKEVAGSGEGGATETRAGTRGR